MIPIETVEERGRLGCPQDDAGVHELGEHLADAAVSDVRARCRGNRSPAHGALGVREDAQHGVANGRQHRL